MRCCSGASRFGANGSLRRCSTPRSTPRFASAPRAAMAARAAVGVRWGPGKRSAVVARHFRLVRASWIPGRAWMSLLVGTRRCRARRRLCRPYGLRPLLCSLTSIFRPPATSFPLPHRATRLGASRRGLTGLRGCAARPDLSHHDATDIAARGREPVARRCAPIPSMITLANGTFARLGPGVPVCRDTELS